MKSLYFANLSKRMDKQNTHSKIRCMRPRTLYMWTSGLIFIFMLGYYVVDQLPLKATIMQSLPQLSSESPPDGESPPEDKPTPSTQHTKRPLPARPLKPLGCVYDHEEAQFHYFLKKKVGLSPASTVQKSNKNSEPMHCQKTVLKYEKNIKKTHYTAWKSLKNVSGSVCCQYKIKPIQLPNGNAPQSVVYEISETKCPKKRTKTSYFVPKRSCSDGGSEFKAIVNSQNTRHFCHTKDLFNGTYHTTCFIHEERSNLSFTLTNINYYAYVGVVFRHLPLFNITMPDPVRKNRPRIKYDCLTCLNGPSSLRSFGNYSYPNVWFKTSELDLGMTVRGVKWNLLQDGCPLMKLNNSGLKDCLGKFKNITIIGDSHMKFLLYHLLLRLGKLNPKLSSKFEGSYMIGHINFRWSRSPDDMRKELKSFRKNFKSVNQTSSNKSLPSDLLIIHSPEWDIRLSNLMDHIKGLESLFGELQSLVERWDRSVRIIWIGMFPSRRIPTVGLNGWIYKWVASLGVEVFDVNSMIFPFVEETRCGNHYICVDPKTNSYNGTVGPLVHEALYSYICHKTQGVFI